MDSKTGILKRACLVKILKLMPLIFVLFMAKATAQTPVWQGKGRIAISADGNEHDHDDWAATPLTLALLAASGW